jgi:hypothetical protein
MNSISEETRGPSKFGKFVCCILLALLMAFVLAYVSSGCNAADDANLGALRLDVSHAVEQGKDKFCATERAVGLDPSHLPLKGICRSPLEKAWSAIEAYQVKTFEHGQSCWAGLSVHGVLRTLRGYLSVDVHH